jgi:3-hydroxyisobutyrate dehydrogenase-like beta-hydroxyacid dehydrogenase
MGSERKDIVETPWVDTVVIQAPNERRNSDVARVVNRAIATSVLVSVSEAMKLMEEAGISKNISLRVLNSKTRRRASDWQ